jgi:hypothetical protein
MWLQNTTSWVEVHQLHQGMFLSAVQVSVILKEFMN